MTNERIWAPWRLEYVKDAAKDSETDCIFCAKPNAGDDEAALIVHRGELCFVILNLFPYTNGHLMVAPYEHVATLPDLNRDTATTSDVTRAGSPGRVSSTTSTCMSSPAGVATPTSCPCSPTRG